MKLGFRLDSPLTLGALAVILQAASAAAQEPAPPPAPAPEATPVAPAAVEATPPAPTPVAPPPEAPASVVNEPALAPPAPLAAEPEKAPEEAPPPLNLSFWGRVDTTISNGEDLNDLSSTGDFQLHASGKVYGIVSFTTNLIATYNPAISGTAGLLDGIIQIEPCDYFNIWLGRMLVPVDRSNFSGPYFMAPWFYPGFGFADGQVGAPLEGPNGRNDGVTVWGQVGGGLFKYYAGVYDLYDVSQKPLYSGRISLHLLNPEPGYYGSSTYYGKDLLGIGLGVQTKKDGYTQTDADGNVTAADTYTEFNADILFEKNLDGAGVLDLEGAFYKFSGDYRVTDASWFALASYLLPGDIGPGKLQPLVRVQQAIPEADGADTSTLIDAQLGYIVNSYNTRFAIGYRNGTAGDAKTQAVFFGAQILK